MFCPFYALNQIPHLEIIQYGLFTHGQLTGGLLILPAFLIQPGGTMWPFIRVPAEHLAGLRLRRGHHLVKALLSGHVLSKCGTCSPHRYPAPVNGPPCIEPNSLLGSSSPLTLMGVSRFNA